MKLILSFFCFIVLFIGNTNSNVRAEISNNKTLKIGLIVPLSGEYKEIGKSILNSLRIGLNRLKDKKIEIYPKDNKGNAENTLSAAKELQSLGISIIIGPIFHENLIHLEEVNNLIFLSLTNKITNLPSNVISVGINARSQLSTIVSFLEKKNLSKTIVLIPRSKHEEEVRNSISKIKYKFFKIYSYDTDPEKLTKQIEQITKYKQRKDDLNRRVKILENSDLMVHKKELKKLKKKDTLGGVNFDSVIIADFDQNLKSVVTSFLYTDVSHSEIKFITLNQWFDETLFKENSTNYIYFPSVNNKNYNKFKETYYINFNTYPIEISIISYDILGLIYHLFKKNNYEINRNQFLQKTKFSGSLGIFEIEKNSINYQLEIYQVFNGNFKKIN
jgi:vacuolar-type H+-ATPase subunit F/Vma7